MSGSNLFESGKGKLTNEVLVFDFAAIGPLQHLEVSLELRGAAIVLFVVKKVNEVALIQIVGRWGRLLARVLLLAVELLHVNVGFLDL